MKSPPLQYHRSMSRIAILGGSFNPPHLAHQMACLWALSTGQADRVWLMPCHGHPFGKQLVSFEDRCTMCEAATADFAAGTVAVTRVEGELGGESRTHDTLQHLIGASPQHRFSLIIGSDILLEKDSWYRFDDIERMVQVLVLGRRGYPSPDGVPVLPAISSTRIRETIAVGGDVSSMVPAGVLAYIQQRSLYIER